MMVNTVICIVGPIAAGKGTVVEILKKNGFIPYSFSDRIKEEIKTRNLEVTRFSLNEVSNELRKNIGPDVWAKRNVDAINRDEPERVVVDGARNPHEVELLQKTYNAKVLGVTADQNVRFERLKARGAVNENLSFEQFKELDDRENSQTGDFEQQINECLKRADIVIENNGTVEELKNKVENYLQTIDPLSHV